MHFLTLLLISLRENVTECHFPHFFFLWCIGAAQVHAVTHVASGRLDSLRESGGGGVSSSPPSFPFLLSVSVLT